MLVAASREGVQRGHLGGVHVLQRLAVEAVGVVATLLEPMLRSPQDVMLPLGDITMYMLGRTLYPT